MAIREIDLVEVVKEKLQREAGIRTGTQESMESLIAILSEVTFVKDDDLARLRSQASLYRKL